MSRGIDIEKIIIESIEEAESYRPKKLYRVYLPSLAKALLEETNRKYQFYEFIISNTSALTHSINPQNRKQVYVKVPLWFYDLAKQQGFNEVGIYLLSAGWMNFFNAKMESKTPAKTVRVYEFLYKAFGIPLFPERYKVVIETILNNRLYQRPWKVFDYNHRVAKRLMYVRKRYGLTKTNTMLLYLAFFLKYIKDFMVRQ